MIGLFIAILLFLTVLLLSIIFPAKYLLLPLFFFFLSIYFVTFSQTLSRTKTNNNVVIVSGYSMGINIYLLLLSLTYLLALIAGCTIKNIIIKY